MKKKNTIQRLTLCSVLLSLMLIMGYVENQIPVVAGTPGIKLGVSNGILLFALLQFGFPYAGLLMVSKVLLSAILFSGVGAMPYALAGGTLSLLGMTLLCHIKGVHPVVISMAGGLLHNVGQVSLAMIMLGTPTLLFYLAILMPVGMLTGAGVGVACVEIMKRLRIPNIYAKEKQKKIDKTNQSC